MMKALFCFIAVTLLILGSSMAGAADPEVPLIVIQDTSAESTQVESDTPIDSVEIQIPDAEVAQNSGAFLRAIEGMRKTVVPKMDTFLLKLRVPSTIREFVMGKFHRDLDQAATVVRKSNANGYSISGIAVGGVGISELIMKAIESYPYAKWIPLQGRFGLIVGGGISVLRVRQDGKNKMLIRFHASYEKVDRIITWMLEGFLGGSFSKVSEQLNEEIRTFEKVTLRAVNMGLAGRMIMNENHYEYAISSGVPATPIVSGSYVYESEMHQYRLNVIPANMGSWLRSFKKPLCRQALPI